MMKKFCGMLALLLILSACGNAPTPTAQVDDVSTIVATTLQSLTASAPTIEVQPTQVSGAPVSLDTISFVIPTGIANSVQMEVVGAVPPSEGMPWWEIHPPYVKYPLQGYLLTNTFHDPIIYVYPADEFIQMSEGVGLGISTLKNIISSPEQTLPEELPFLPTFNADQVFYSNHQILEFQNGKGVRYLTQFDQAPFPINNHELFYTFQGITNDGKYYVSAVLPVHASFLVEYGSPEYPLPADGIPFDWDNYENTPAYIEAVKQKLNSTDSNSFTPSLSTLDTMIQSIAITGTP